MPIDPDLTQRTITRYLQGQLSCAEAAELIAGPLSPVQRLAFVIDMPLQVAATPTGRMLYELRWAIVRSGAAPEP